MCSLDLQRRCPLNCTGDYRRRSTIHDLYLSLSVYICRCLVYLFAPAQEDRSSFSPGNMTEYYPSYQWRQDYDSERSGPLRPPTILSVLQNVQRRREYENNKNHRIYNKASRPCGPTSPGLRESTVNVTHSRQERPFYTPAKQRRSNATSNPTGSSRYQGQHPQEKRLRLDRGAADCRERLVSRDTNTTPMANSRTGYKHKRPGIGTIGRRTPHTHQLRLLNRNMTNQSLPGLNDSPSPYNARLSVLLVSMRKTSDAALSTKSSLVVHTLCQRNRLNRDNRVRSRRHRE